MTSHRTDVWEERFLQQLPECPRPAQGMRGLVLRAALAASTPGDLEPGGGPSSGGERTAPSPTGALRPGYVSTLCLFLGPERRSYSLQRKGGSIWPDGKDSFGNVEGRAF